MAKLITGDCIEELKQLPDNSVDSVVTDPPYGLKFMGKEFDNLGEGAQQREWHRQWAEQALRVLKPGGHLLAFGGSRTYHHLATAVEDAGFEIRDQMQWLYGSGFPKSLNVGKAIDKRGGKKVLWFGPWFREWRKKNKITQKEVAALFPSKTGGLTGCVANWELGFNLPTPEQFNKITKAFNLPFDSIEEAEREVVEKKRRTAGEPNVPIAACVGNKNDGWFDITAPATDEAARWEGWGTALKPAHEPIVVARKPFKGTVAENVLEHGTGAINVDGCRVGTTVETWPASRSYAPGQIQPGSKGKTESTGPIPPGRWPANIILDEEAGQLLDEQSGYSSKKYAPPDRRTTNGSGASWTSPKGQRNAPENYGDQGGASRFFYCPKAAKGERNAGTDKNIHPTVKPVELMRYLCRLVTPPGGTVLDPFLGSGTTGIAAHLEGFEFIGIEREAEYMEIAAARIKWWSQYQGEQGDSKEILKQAQAAEKKPKKRRSGKNK